MIVPMLLLVAAMGVQDLPDAVVVLNGGARVTSSPSVTVQVKLKNPGFGRLEMSLSVDPHAADLWIPYQEFNTVELPGEDGVKTVLLRLRDENATESKPIAATILLERTPPQAQVAAPERVATDRVILSSNVADAVGMQWTEDPKVWQSWVPYLQTREIPLSAGEGMKTVLVRYRDEAGNVSRPARIQVDVSSQSSLPAPPPGFRWIRIGGEPLKDDRLAVRLWITAVGIAELEVRVDDAEPLPRQKFASPLTLEIPKTRGAHRLRFKLRDDSGAETSTELAFLESDLNQDPTDPVPEPASARARWSVGLKLGIVPQAIQFEAVTSVGPRKLDPGVVGAVRLESRFDFLDPLFGGVSFELLTGKEISVFSGEFDLGVRLLSTEILSTRLDVELEAGLLYSKLQVDRSGFGSFDGGIGFRAGIGARLALSESFWLDASIDFRSVSYDWSGTVISGDREARLRSAALLAGLSFRF